MIHFVGAGPGAPDLITVRGRELLEKADVVIYAGSLVNPELLRYAPPAAEIHDSAVMTLGEIVELMVFTGRSVSRWICWMHITSPMIPVRVSVPASERRRR